MTTDFDEFAPGAWQEKGVLKAPRVRRNPPRGERRMAAPLVATVSISLACVGATSTLDAVLPCGFSSGTHDMAHRAATVAYGQTDLKQVGDFIAPSSWPDLLELLKALPDAEDVGGPDPEPIF